MESLARSKDINDPKIKNEIAAQMIPLIEDVPNTVERDTYRQQLARLLRVDEDSLSGAAKNKTTRRQYCEQQARTVQKCSKCPTPRNIIFSDPNSEMEQHCLALLIKIPDLTYRLDRLLQQSGLDRLTQEDFSNTENVEIFLVIARAITQDEFDPAEYILENITAPQKDILQKRLESYNPDKINEDDLISDLMRTIIRLRQNRIKENLRQLRFLQEEQQEQDQKEEQKMSRRISHSRTW